MTVIPTADLSVTAEAPRKPAAPPPAPPKAAVQARSPSSGGFGDLLSSFNPLQYIPVVGTIYRSATGDTIPETNRMAGSLVFSGLTAGPVGVVTNVAATMLERITGIDPEKIGASLLASIGIGHKPTATAVVQAEPDGPPAPPHTPTATAGVSGPPGPDHAASRGLSPEQLAAYGVRREADGSLRRGSEQGADVLNGIELARLGTGAAGLASAAYTASGNLAG